MGTIINQDERAMRNRLEFSNATAIGEERDGHGRNRGDGGELTPALGTPCALVRHGERGSVI
jgi:hypothetical protein